MSIRSDFTPQSSHPSDSYLRKCPPPCSCSHRYLRITFDSPFSWQPPLQPNPPTHLVIPSPVHPLLFLNCRCHPHPGNLQHLSPGVLQRLPNWFPFSHFLQVAREIVKMLVLVLLPKALCWLPPAVRVKSRSPAAEALPALVSASLSTLALTHWLLSHGLLAFPYYPWAVWGDSSCFRVSWIALF